MTQPCGCQARVEKLERDRAKLLAALEEAAGLLIWAKTHSLEKAGRKFERVLSELKT